jgi:hypothetical protein
MVEEMNPIMRGSLPFKKRRFPHLDLLTMSSMDDHRDSDGALMMMMLPCKGRYDDISSSAEQSAALSLLAAAASGTPTESRSLQLASRLERWQGEPTKHGFPFNEASEKCDNGLSGVLVAAAAAIDLQSEDSATSVSSLTASTKAPLLSPLPNGCHGRTSRNNSYCRRHPCYNGSKYCKLHYQHYIVVGAATDPELMNGVIVEGPDSVLDCDVSSATVDGAAKAASSQVALVHLHQDKRYTGCDDETRCKGMIGFMCSCTSQNLLQTLFSPMRFCWPATTTRGRECAYCAVKDAKYCFLHADYDTNPPPRRGGTGGATKTKEGAMMADAGATISGLAESVGGIAKAGKGKMDNTKRRIPSTSARRLSASKNLEKHMADAPYPLLSTLSTDKWPNRKVIVSTGPLTNHVGLVEKWGNGWVSVRLPGVGLHNRRSFELYLHPNPDSEGCGSETEVPVLEVFDAADSKSVRVVDRNGVKRAEETATPPTPITVGKPFVDVGQVHEVTPLVTCRVIGIDQPAVEGGIRKVCNIMFPTSIVSSSPNTVPESPIPAQQGAISWRVNGEKPANLPQTNIKSHAMATEESAHGDIPLVRSILLAQQNRASKQNKLGLLFGTAALERSRRVVHKPVRYEDRELIGKKLKKRDNESIYDGNLDGPSKRVCGEDSRISRPSVTPVVSTSDEESSEAPVDTGLVSV